MGGSSPFYAATGMVAGTAANTVIWYTGETGTDPARSTATAKIDQSLSVSYGARANEDAIRDACAECRDACGRDDFAHRSEWSGAEQ